MSSGGLFSFRPELGETPDVLERRRKVAEAMLASAVGQPATTIGGGLSALGQAIGGRLALGRVNRATAAGQAGAADVFSKLFGGGATAPGETAAMPGTEPVSTGGTAAVADALADGTSSAPVATVDLSGDKAAFVAALMPAAIEASKVTGVDPRIIVAQAAQETGWGRSAPGNNYFGIKSHGKGGGQTFTTHEVINGKRVKIQDSFRRFASPGESVAGYAQFLRDNPRYKAFMAARGLDAQLAALGKSGYATDPNYAASVGAIARGLPMPAGGGGVPAVTAALAGTEPIASADPTALAAAGAIDPAAKDDLYQPAAPAAAGMPLPYDPLSSANPGAVPPVAPFRPAGGPTPYNPLGADQTWQAGSPPPPLPPMRPAEAPVAPPVAPAAPAASAVAPVAQALGVDPLPQTSGLVGPVASAGHESLSPGAQAVSQALGGGAGRDALAGGGGGSPAAAAAATSAAAAPGGGSAVPPAAVPGESAALPGTEPVSSVPPTAGGLSPMAQKAIAVIQNPWSNEGQLAIAKTMLEQELQQADPQYRANLEKTLLDIERTRNPPKSRDLTPQEIADRGYNPDRRYRESPTGEITEVPGTKRETIKHENLIVDANTGELIATIPDPGYRAATPEEAAKYGAAAGQFDLSNNKFEPINPPTGFSVTVGPDGTVSLVQGPGAGKGLTEGQSKDTVYVTRAKGAQPTLDKYGEALTSYPEQLAELDPTGIARSQQSPEFQLATVAGREFLQAILRKDSQGQITHAETVEYGQVYLPQPGDGPEIIEYKRQARARAIAAIEAGMPSSAILQTELASGVIKQRTGTTGDVIEVPSEADAVPAAPASEAAPVQITTDEEFNDLPSGTRFIGPDGKIRRKP